MGSRTGTALVLSGLFMDTVENNPKKVVGGGVSGACFAGIMDILLITVFCGAVSAGLHWQLSQLVIQFLFPLCVTACICFGILCSRHWVLP